MGGKTGTQTTTNTSGPTAEAQPYYAQGIKDAWGLYTQDGPKYYPGSTVAGFSPAQQQAQQAGLNRAQRGSPNLRAAQGYNANVLAGKYLQNPNDDAVFNSIQNKVMPSVNGNFASAGRYGSGAHAGAASSALTDAYAPYASQNYQFGQNQMMQAAGDAQGLAQADYNDINAMYDIGTQQQGLAQSEIDDAKGRWDWAQDLPYNKLSQLMGLLGGNGWGSTASTTPYYRPSTASQIGGLGLGLLGLL